MPVPGLVGEVPQVDAIGHVRPDFRSKHEEAALGRPAFAALFNSGWFQVERSNGGLFARRRRTSGN